MELSDSQLHVAGSVILLVLLASAVILRHAELDIPNEDNLTLSCDLEKQNSSSSVQLADRINDLEVDIDGRNCCRSR